MNNNARITSGTVAILDKPGWYRACIVGALTAGAVKQPDVRLIINGKSVGGPLAMFTAICSPHITSMEIGAQDGLLMERVDVLLPKFVSITTLARHYM